MTRTEMINKVARIRGLKDRYTLIIARYAEDTTITDKVILQLMYDILLGVSMEE